MNIDDLANDAVAALTSRITSGAADAVGNLITQRLSASKTGAHALSTLQADPSQVAGQELAGNVLADELTRDPSFAQALAEALGQPSTQISSVTVGERARIKGDVAGGNIDKSTRFHIGSIRFGGGGLAALILVGTVTAGGAGYGVYDVITVSPGEGYVSESKHRNMMKSSGVSVDLDATDQRQTDGDGITDITLDHTSIVATGGALMVRLPSGTVPNPETCDRALENRASKIDNVAKGDLICVRTSRRALAAVTISGQNTVNENSAAKLTLYTLDWGYWAPR